MTDAAVTTCHGILHPTGHGYGPDVIALADKVNDKPSGPVGSDVFPSQGRQLGSAQTAAEQDRDHSDVSDAGVSLGHSLSQEATEPDPG